MSAPNNEHLFVYGTLRKDAPHQMSDHLRRYANYLEGASFKGTLFDAGSYPAAVVSDDESDVVYGDLYRLDDPASIFACLDPYEGYNAQHPLTSLFIRKKVSVQLQQGHCKSWAYCYNKPTDALTPIPSGDYLTYLNENNH